MPKTLTTLTSAMVGRGSQFQIPPRCPQLCGYYISHGKSTIFSSDGGENGAWRRPLRARSAAMSISKATRDGTATCGVRDGGVGHSLCCFECWLWCGAAAICFWGAFLVDRLATSLDAASPSYSAVPVLVFLLSRSLHLSRMSYTDDSFSLFSL